MHLVFSKLTEGNLCQFCRYGYPGEIKSSFEFISGQGKNLFVEVAVSDMDKNDRDFVLLVSCALLTGGERTKEELSNLAYHSSQALVMLDRFQRGNAEHLFGVELNAFQPFKSGWLVTCSPATEVEAFIFCEKKFIGVSTAQKAVYRPVLH